MHKSIKVGLSFLGLLALALLVLVAINFTFLSRIYSAPNADLVHDVDWFEPLAVVKGAENIPPFNTSKEAQKLHEDTFKQAIEYAESQDSSAFLVWHKNELLVEKYWDQQTADTNVQTFSIHKSIVALAIGAAISEGKIESVNDPVAKYIGNWTEMPFGQITIEHLLTMSSGLELPPVDVNTSMFSHSTNLMHGTDISKVARSLEQVKSPGNVFEYNNSNPQLLVDVIEAASGTNYASFLQEKLWSKFAQDPSYLWLDKENGTAHGFCCFISTPQDLLRLGLLILKQGLIAGEQVIPKTWIEASTQPSSTNSNYGYLTWLGEPYNSARKYRPNAVFGALHSAPYLAEDLVFFDGFGGQRVYIIPSQELVIVRVGAAKFDFDDAILPNSVISALSQLPKDLEARKYKNSAIAYADVTIAAPHADEIALRVSYSKGSKRSYPLVLFSHGHFLTNLDYHRLTDKWVEQGYVVIAPLHIDTGEMDYVQKLTERVGSDWIAVSRILDMKAVIAQLDNIANSLDGFNGRIHNDNIIAAGHSLGALSAQILAGATQELQGNSIYPFPKELSDSRVSAVIAVSPPGLMEGYLSKSTWQQFDKPQLVITGTNDFFEFIWPDYKEHFVSYETAVPGDNYLLVLDGMDHYLGNLIGRLDREAPPQTEALENIVNVSLQVMHEYSRRESKLEARETVKAFINNYNNENVLELSHR